MDRNARTILEYWLILGLEKIVILLPLLWAVRSINCLCTILRILLKRRERIIYTNIKSAFPNLNKKEVYRLISQVWYNISQTIVEFIHIEQLRPDNITNYLEFSGEDVIHQNYKSATGMLILTGHIGNWELAIGGLALKGYPIAVIAQDLKNDKVNLWVKNKRLSTGMKLLPRQQGVAETVRYLNQGYCVCILMDQSLSTGGGIKTRFFQRSVLTSPIIATLARRLEIPVIPMYSRRTNIMKLKVIIEKPLSLVRTERVKDDIVKNTQMVNDVIEQWVCQTPEQWFWLHDRWK